MPRDGGVAVTAALHLAAALEIDGPATLGKSWTSVCIRCLHAADPTETAIARRVGGDCLRCPTSGRDVFVALLPAVSA